MELQKDFEDLCVSLNARVVEYVIVGGYALAFHGAPRFTGDLDIFIRPTAANVERLLAALKDSGFHDVRLDPDDLLRQRKILQLGRQPVQVHIMAFISGVPWETAWDSRESGTYGGTPVFFLGREAFLANKRAVGRTKDLADIEALLGAGSRD